MRTESSDSKRVRRRRWPRLLALWGLMGCASAPAPSTVTLPTESNKPVAQAPDVLPEAAQVFERYVAALGGRQRILRSQAYVARGTLSVPEQGIEGELVIYMAAPNKSLITYDVPGFGEVREGFDGTVGWSVDPMSGPRAKRGEELRDLAHRSDYHFALNAQKLYKSMKTTARKVFGRHDCYVVELVTNDGRAEILYFEVEGGLLVGREATAPTPAGEVRVVSQYEAYQKFDGLAQATRIRLAQGPTQSVISIREVEENPPKLPSFEPPPEIKALLAEPEE